MVSATEDEDEEDEEKDEEVCRSAVVGEELENELDAPAVHFPLWQSPKKARELSWSWTLNCVYLGMEIATEGRS